MLPWQWLLFGLLLLVYGACGFLLGAICGAALFRVHQRNSSVPQIVSVWTLCSAFSLNLMFLPSLTRSEQVALAIALVLVVAFSAALFSNRLSMRIKSWASPWPVSLLLVGVPWVTREVLTANDSSLTKAGFAAIVFGIVVILGILARPLNRPAALLASVTVVCAVFGISATLVNPEPSIRVEGRARSSPDKPNVLLIVMDTVRADHMSIYGYPRDTTPRLRDFGNAATIYTRAIAGSDFTLASHAAMFTGLYPDWNGAIQSTSGNLIAVPINNQHATVADLLGSLGYWTAEVGANYGFLAPWTGLTHGFALSELRGPVDLSSYERPYYLREGVRRVLGRYVNFANLDRSAMTAQDINQRALKVLNQAHEKQVPFFLFLNYMDAHTPYLPSAPFDTRFGGGIRKVARAALHDLKLKVDRGERKLLPAEARNLVAEYDDGIAEEDSALGALFQRMREMHIYDQTLIIVTSDHGDTFGEHDLMDHFVGFVYQELVHVTLLIKYPGQRSAARSHDWVSHVDFLPTILECVHAQLPSGLQGRSLLGPEPTGGAVVYSRGTRSPLVGLGNRRFDGLRRAVFSQDMKLISSTAGPPELYDLRLDPHEQHNVFEPNSPLAERLSERLNKWIAAMPHPKRTLPKYDRSAVERLKSLGYVQ